MDNKTFIWTEIINCAKVGAIMLESFNQHHPDRTLHVFCTAADKDEIETLLPKLTSPDRLHYPFVFIEVDGTQIEDAYTRGHEGTARVFASVLHVHGFVYDYAKGMEVAVHIDSDIFVKAPFISDLLNKLDVNVSAVGSRRAYADNLGGSVVSGPDTISTYCMAIKVKDIPYYEMETFVKMCQGSFNPAGFDTLDFFDPVIHSMLSSGKAVAFLDPALYGGQFIGQKGKDNTYKSNAHLDMGTYLCHFGGAGSGCAYFNGKSTAEPSYMNWAVSRYALVDSIFYGGKLDFSKFNIPECEILGDRWVNGMWNEQIYNDITNEIKDEKRTTLNKWFADKGDTTLRLEHNIPYKGMVWDVGAYVGDWATKMHAKYGCQLVCYEPVTSIYLQCKDAFSSNMDVIVENYALGESQRAQLIELEDNASSLFLKTNVDDLKDNLEAWISVHDIASEFNYEKLNKKTKSTVDLLKLNVEGAEYEIFDRIIEKKLATKFMAIMVQFHDHVPGFQEKYDKIASELSKTHDLKWRYPFVWEKWELKSKFRK